MSIVKERLVRLAVLVALGGAGAGAVVWQTHKSEQDKKDEDAQKKVLRFSDAKSARELVLTTPTGSYTVVREGSASGKDTWTLTAPRRVPAEDSTVQGILDALSELKRTAVVGEKSGAAIDKKLLGLDPPRFTVTLTDSQGQKETLFAGERNTFDGSVFVQREGDAAVGVVAGALEYQLDKDLFKLRDKRLVPFESEQVSRVAVRVDGKPRYSFDKNGETYALLAPKRVAGDSVQLGALLSALASTSASAFVTEEASAADVKKYGLEKPKVEIDIALTTGTPKTVLVGELDAKSKKTYYAMVEGRGPIVELSSNWVIEKLVVDPDTLRDKHVLVFARDDVGALRVKSGDKTLAFKRTADSGADQWAMTEPEAAKAQDAVLTGLLYRLWNLKARRILSESAADADKKARGLTTPAMSVELTKKDGTPLGTMFFGAVDGEEQFVATSAGPRLDVIEASAAKDIAVEPAAYKEADPTAKK